MSSWQKVIYGFGFILSLCIGCNAFANYDDIAQQAKLDRIKPVGQVRIAGTEKQAVKKVPKKEVTKQVSQGEKIYNQHCAVCHTQGIAGAPKFRDEKAWHDRIKQDMKTIVDKAMKGFNAMPPKGTCINCDEKGLRAAIEYMMPPKS